MEPQEILHRTRPLIESLHSKLSKLEVGKFISSVASVHMLYHEHRDPCSVLDTVHVLSLYGGIVTQYAKL